MNHMRKLALGELVVPNVRGMEADRRIGGQVRRFLRECSRISRQRNGVCAEIQPSVRPSEALEQPAPKEARGASDEDALAAQVAPQRLGAREDVIEIFSQTVC